MIKVIIVFNHCHIFIDDIERDENADFEIDQQLMDNVKYIKQSLQKGQNNDQTTTVKHIQQEKSLKPDTKQMNVDLEGLSYDKDDFNERDIDLEEQYNNLIAGKDINEIDQLERDSNDSLNDVDSKWSLNQYGEDDDS